MKTLSFPDRPDEKFTLRHRDIIESIRSLWGNPELAEHLVYKPSSLFSDESLDHRLFNEMWTGKWWQYIQVSSDALAINIFLIKHNFTGQTARRPHACATHCLYR